MVRTPTEDARPSTAETAPEVQTERNEEEARRDSPTVGGPHQQGPNWDCKLARSGDGKKGMESCNAPTQVNNPIPIHNQIEQLDPAQRP